MGDIEKDKEDLRQLTREAHEAMADLKKVVKEGKAVVQEIKALAAQEVDSLVVPEIKRVLKEWNEATQAAIKTSEESVYERFDQLGDILLGVDRESQRKGQPSIPELIEIESKLRGRTNE